MKRAVFLACLLLSIVSLAAMTGCSDDDDSENSNAPATTSSPATTNAPAATSSPAAATSSSTSLRGTLTANPNPIKVCDGSGRGKTTISWTLSQPQRMQIRVGSPTGGTLVDSAQATGKVDTGSWATDGATFYLQDVASGQTISTLTVKVNDVGCK